MKRIICIGECNYNIILDPNGCTLGAMPGGIIASAAAIMAGLGFNVTMASEAAADPIGDMALARLAAAGVDLSSVDRYTEGRTALDVHRFDNLGNVSIIRYENYPDEAFDIVWPRIGEDDIIVFGGYYALDARMRPRLQQFIANAAERKAILVYLPGFNAARQPRITRVMPAILENLELADMVITRSDDLNLIFGISTPEKCYNDHIDFYCRSLVNIDTACAAISYHTGRQVSTIHADPMHCHSMLWQAGAVAGVVSALALRGSNKDIFEHPAEELRLAILEGAAHSAAEQASLITAPWQAI